MSDKKGIKQYNLPNNFKTIVIAGTTTVVLVISGLSFYIKTISDKLTTLEERIKSEKIVKISTVKPVMLLATNTVKVPFSPSKKDVLKVEESKKLALLEKEKEEEHLKRVEAEKLAQSLMVEQAKKEEALKLAKLEKIKQEKAEKEKRLKQKLAEEKLAKEKVTLAKIKKEEALKLAKLEKIKQEKAEKEKRIKQKLAEEKLAKKKAALAKAKKEEALKLAKLEKIKQEKVKKEKRAKQKLAKEKLAKKKAALAKEKKEKSRKLAKAKKEKALKLAKLEKIKKEKVEKEKRNKKKLAKAKLAKKKAALAKAKKEKKKNLKSSNNTYNCYADFKKSVNLRKSYKVFKNHQLLKKANGRNTVVKIDVSEQRVKLLVNGKVALSSPCTTGAKHKFEPNTKTYRDKHTPLGTFKIMEKVAAKKSTIFGEMYRNGKKVYHGDRRKYRGPKAKYVGHTMHNWMRLTSGGIGLHASKYIKRYPGSNGCVRLPLAVSKTIFSKVRSGTKVMVVN